MCVLATPFHVASSLTADNNDARKPPTISYMWALVGIININNSSFNFKTL